MQACKWFLKEILFETNSKPKEKLAPRFPRKKRATIQYHANKLSKDFQAAHGLLPWKTVWTFVSCMGLNRNPTTFGSSWFWEKCRHVNGFWKEIWIETNSTPKEKLAPRILQKKRATIQYHANKPFKDFQAAHGLLPWKIVWTFVFLYCLKRNPLLLAGLDFERSSSFSIVSEKNF